MKRNKNGNLERMPAIYTKSKPRSVQSFTDLNKKAFTALHGCRLLQGLQGSGIKLQWTMEL